MHELDRELARAVYEFATARLEADPPDLGAVGTPGEVARLVGAAVTPEGLGARGALALFTDTLLPLTFPIDHPRYLAFIPSAPTPAASLMDLLVSASSVYGGSWLEGAGAVHAENEALAWLAGLAGLPDTAGGCFVQGGTNGNISALHAAREWARRTSPSARRIACSDEVHSSVRSTARIMDRRAPRTWGSSTTSPASPRSPASTGCGSTSTARTARRACAPRACAGASPASSTPTR